MDPLLMKIGEMKKELLSNLEQKDSPSVRFIMGNESCDLDSVCCSIAYSQYLLHCPNTLDFCRIPISLLNIEKREFEIRTEVIYWLGIVFFPSDEEKEPIFEKLLDILLFLDDLVSDFSNLKLTLVDHNRLKISQEEKWGKFVDHIIDHHQEVTDDEKNVAILVKKNIDINVGSCSSLIAIELLDNWKEMPFILGKLLLGAIVLDTKNLTNHKTGDIDRKAIERLYQKFCSHLFPFSFLFKISDQLLSAKSDCSHLNLYSLLSKDYKSVPNTNFGMSTFHFAAKISAEKFESSIDQCHQFCADKSLVMLIMITFGSEIDNRLWLIFFTDDFALQSTAISAFSRKLQLKLDQKSPHCFSMRRMCSRKQILPVLSNLIEEKFDSLKEKLCRKVLALDGGFGTELEKEGFKIQGDPLWNARCLVDNPDLVVKIHKKFLNAGAEIIETNSYHGNIAILCKELDISRKKAVQIVEKSVILAKKAIREYCEDEKIKIYPYLAGTIGPYATTFSNGSEYHGKYMDEIDEQLVIDYYYEQAQCLLNMGVDILAFETILALCEARCVLKALDKLPKCRAWISFSCMDGERINHGELFSLVASEVSINDKVICVGINCTAPQNISSLLKSVKKNQLNGKFLVIYPNSGEKYVPEKGWLEPIGHELKIADYVEEWIESGANIIGGCCRISSLDIREIVTSINDQI